MRRRAREEGKGGQRDLKLSAATPGSPGNREPLLWDYKTANKIQDVQARDYFDTAASILRRGDYIRVTAENGKSIMVVHSVTLAPGSLSTNAVEIASVQHFVD
jgi:hypothetical protein